MKLNDWFNCAITFYVLNVIAIECKALQFVNDHRAKNSFEMSLSLIVNDY